MTWQWVVLILGGAVLVALLVGAVVFVVAMLRTFAVIDREQAAAEEQFGKTMSRLEAAARKEREGWPGR